MSDEEVKQGYWKGLTSRYWKANKDGYSGEYKDYIFYKCSVCGRKTVIRENFCPSCGKKMSKKEIRND